MNITEKLLIVIPIIAVGCVWITLMVNEFNTNYGTNINTTTVESFNYNSDAQQQVLDMYTVIIDSNNIIIQAFGLVFIGAWQTVLSITTMVNIINRLIISMFTIFKIPAEMIIPFWIIIFILIIFGLRRLIFKGE
jgi:hypothetical protein